jgi:hypothetical protein
VVRLLLSAPATMRPRSNAAGGDRTLNRGVNAVSYQKREWSRFGLMCGNAQKSALSARTLEKVGCRGAEGGVCALFARDAPLES